MILGIDIGGTNIGLGLVDNGHIVRCSSVKSFEQGFSQEETLEYLGKQIDAFMTPEVRGIGFGVPSLVDVEKGVVYDTANIASWQEVHLKSYFEKKYGCPVAVNNDANCYALGAYASLSGEKPESLVAMTLGTGLGMGIVIGGKLFCGANCGAGELSCLPYLDSTIEDYTSKKFFQRIDCDPKVLGAAAREGDKKALKIFSEFGEHLGYAVSVILYAYDPCTVVIGGGLGNNYSLFRDSMYDYLKKNFPYRKTIDNFNVVVATDTLIPVLGAASLL